MSQIVNARRFKASSRALSGHAEGGRVEFGSMLSKKRSEDGAPGDRANGLLRVLAVSKRFGGSDVGCFSRALAMLGSRPSAAARP
jgi:hypothetical protein